MCLVLICFLNKFWLTALKGNTKDLELSFTNNYFDFIRANEQESTNLIIISHTDLGTYEITVKAKVEDPEFTDSVKFYVNLIEFGTENKTVVIKEIVFAKDLFKENPECLELNELLEQAEFALNNNQFEKAASLTEAAVNGCRDLITSLGKKVEEPRKRLFYESKWIVLILMMIILFLIVWIILSNIKKRPLNFSYKEVKKPTKIKLKVKPKKVFKKIKKKNVWKRKV